MKQAKNEGFTLIELLVVIVIIGVLSTLAAVAFNSARMKARDTKRKADIRQLSTAVQLYYNMNNSYPSNAGSYPDWPAGFKAELSPFLSKLPADSLNSETRYYGVTRMTWAPDVNCNGHYVLWAYLESSKDPDFGKHTCGFGGGHYFVVLENF